MIPIRESNVERLVEQIKDCPREIGDNLEGVHQDIFYLVKEASGEDTSDGGAQA